MSPGVQKRRAAFAQIPVSTTYHGDLQQVSSSLSFSLLVSETQIITARTEVRRDGREGPVRKCVAALAAAPGA